MVSRWDHLDYVFYSTFKCYSSIQLFDIQNSWCHPSPAALCLTYKPLPVAQQLTHGHINFIWTQLLQDICSCWVAFYKESVNIAKFTQPPFCFWNYLKLQFKSSWFVEASLMSGMMVAVVSFNMVICLWMCTVQFPLLSIQFHFIGTLTRIKKWETSWTEPKANWKFKSHCPENTGVWNF